MKTFFFFFWRPPEFGRKKRLNFRFRPKNHSQFWWRPFFLFFGDHLNLGEKNVWMSDFGRKIILNFGEDIRIFEVLCFKSPPPPKFSGSATASALKEIVTQIRMLYQLVIKQKVAQKLTLVESWNKIRGNKRVNQIWQPVPVVSLPTKICPVCFKKHSIYVTSWLSFTLSSFLQKINHIFKIWLTFRSKNSYLFQLEYEAPKRSCTGRLLLNFLRKNYQKLLPIKRCHFHAQKTDTCKRGLN